MAKEMPLSALIAYARHHAELVAQFLARKQQSSESRQLNARQGPLQPLSRSHGWQGLMALNSPKPAELCVCCIRAACSGTRQLIALLWKEGRLSG